MKPVHIRISGGKPRIGFDLSRPVVSWRGTPHPCRARIEVSLDPAFRDLVSVREGDLSPLLRNIPFLVPDEPRAHPLLSKGDPLPVHRMVVSDSRDMDFSLCLKGTGAIIAPRVDICLKLRQESRAAADQMRVYPLPGNAATPLYLWYAPDHVLSPADQAFIATAKDSFN